MSEAIRTESQAAQDAGEAISLAVALGMEAGLRLGHLQEALMCSWEKVAPSPSLASQQALLPEETCRHCQLDSAPQEED